MLAFPPSMFLAMSGARAEADAPASPHQNGANRPRMQGIASPRDDGAVDPLWREPGGYVPPVPEIECNE